MTRYVSSRRGIRHEGRRNTISCNHFKFTYLLPCIIYDVVYFSVYNEYFQQLLKEYHGADRLFFGDPSTLRQCHRRGCLDQS